MKRAVSNIAWPRDRDADVATMLSAYGVTGVEVAPTVVWPEPLQVSPEEVRAYRAWWADRGIEVVAMQALLFGHPEFTLFGDVGARDGMLQHLTGMIVLGAQLGAKTLVFGSPRNRARGALPADRVHAIAVEFFQEVGRRAVDHGVALCIEPNPSAYECDYVNTVAEGVALVNAVSSTGFGLHVDAGAMAMNGEHVDNALVLAADTMHHFHASEPWLAPLGTGASAHDQCAAALARIGYTGWVSLEMRAPALGLDALHAPLAVLTAQYGA